MDIIVHKLNVKLLDEVSAALTSVVSDPINLQSFSLYAVQFVFSSNFNAVDPEVKVLGSNSLDAPFTEINVFTPSAAAGTSYSYLLNVEKAGYAFVKLAYTCASGVGTISATINGKVI
jgi:hypothetical protein